jgi:hypothetical protein
VYNSTITANRSAIDAAGILVESPLDIRLESSIVAGNKTDGVELDLGSSAAATVAGTGNLVMAHAPGITVSADTGDPHLGPLRNNGGPTQTHALVAPSPAIDHGNNVHGGQFDQRLSRRVAGSSPDIGAFESVDAIFADGFNVTKVIVQ